MNKEQKTPQDGLPAFPGYTDWIAMKQGLINPDLAKKEEQKQQDKQLVQEDERYVDGFFGDKSISYD